MYKAKAVIIMCMDFRFQSQIHEMLQKKNYLGVCDEIAVAGSSRDFVFSVSEEDEKYVWKQLDLSVRLHDPEEIVFIDHQDCGGYSIDNTIKSGLEKKLDLEEHKKFLRILKPKILDKYPTKKVSMYYASLDGKVEKVTDF